MLTFIIITNTQIFYILRICIDCLYSYNLLARVGGESVWQQKPHFLA